MRKLGVAVPLITAALVLVSACAPGAPVSQPTATSIPATPKPAVATPTSAPATPKPAAAAPTVAPATPKPAPIAVKMSGVARSLTDSGLLIAQERGYFAQEGLNVERIEVASAADVIASLSAGDLDISGGGWSLAHANAILRGVPLKVVADKVSKQRGFVNYRISIRKDLYDSGQITELAHLKGRKIGVASAAAMGVLLFPNLKQANLTLKDVDLVPLTAADMAAALANKSIDAGVIAEPILSKAVADGLVVRHKDLFDVDPPPSAGAIYFSPQFAQNTEGGTRFVTAYIKGLRDYNDAFLKNKGRKETVEVLAKATGITDLALFDKMDMPGFDPDGYADKKGLDFGIKYWVSTGELKESIDIDKVVDNRFVDSALQKLGKYAR